MADLLQQGLGWLEEQRTRHLTRTVTYRRGALSVDVQATIGETVFRLSDPLGAEVRHVRRDYLILAEDLVLGGQTVLPERGDRIEKTDSGETHVHEVMGPGSGEPDWRWSDPYRKTLRIHTKHVETKAGT